MLIAETGVQIDANTAEQEGGGIYTLSPLNFTIGSSNSSSVNANNVADRGGGIYSSGRNAKLTIDYGHTLMLIDNHAESDGGGLGVENGASIQSSGKNCHSVCPSNWQRNGKCNKECMSLECNWYDIHLVDSLQQ
jgi:hypothetical protein